MCIGCTISGLGTYKYLDNYFYPHERVLRGMKQVERNLVEISQPSVNLDYEAVLKKHHKRLVRIRRQWGRAHHEFAKDVTEVYEQLERERERITALPLEPAIQGDTE